MGCAHSKAVDHTEVTLGVDGEGTSGPAIVLLKVKDLLKHVLLSTGEMKSYDVLQQHWTAKKAAGCSGFECIRELFGPKSFKTVPWSQLKRTKYGVLTYCWGNPEKGVWGATWAEMIGALKGCDYIKADPSKRRIKVKYVWIGAPRPRAPALRPPTLRPPRSGPPAVAQISSASTRMTPRRWRRSGGRTRSTPGRTSTT